MKTKREMESTVVGMFCKMDSHSTTLALDTYEVHATMKKKGIGSKETNECFSLSLAMGIFLFRRF